MKNKKFKNLLRPFAFGKNKKQEELFKRLPKSCNSIEINTNSNLLRNKKLMLTMFYEKGQRDSDSNYIESIIIDVEFAKSLTVLLANVNVTEVI